MKMRTILSLEQKKAQAMGPVGLNLLYAIVVLVFMIGFVAGVMAYINAELQTELESSASNTDKNETVTDISNATASQLVPDSNTSLINSVSSVIVYNASGNASETGIEGIGAIASGNYTFNSTGQIQAKTYELNGSDINVTYTYGYPTYPEEYQVVGNSTKGLSNITGKLGLIGTIGSFVAIILLVTIIISVLRRRSGGGLPG